MFFSTFLVSPSSSFPAYFFSSSFFYAFSFSPSPSSPSSLLPPTDVSHLAFATTLLHSPFRLLLSLLHLVFLYVPLHSSLSTLIFPSSSSSLMSPSFSSNLFLYSVLPTLSSYSFPSWRHRFTHLKLPNSKGFLSPAQTVEIFRFGISPLQGLSLNRTRQETTDKHRRHSSS